MKDAEIERVMRRFGFDRDTARRHVQQQHQLAERFEQQLHQAAEDCRQRWSERTRGTAS